LKYVFKPLKAPYTTSITPKEILSVSLFLKNWLEECTLLKTRIPITKKMREIKNDT
jgi:hypothetical protein